MHVACQVFLIILFLIVFVLLIAGIATSYNKLNLSCMPNYPKSSKKKKQETFAALPVEYSDHQFDSMEKGNLFYGSCGPGCAFQCKHRNCPAFQNKLGYSKYPSQIKMPKALPVGANQTMAGPGFTYPVQSCASNPNGVNYYSGKNPYGQVMGLRSHGQQTYGFCEESNEEADEYNNAFGDLRQRKKL